MSESKIKIESSQIRQDINSLIRVIQECKDDIQLLKGVESNRANQSLQRCIENYESLLKKLRNY